MHPEVSGQGYVIRFLRRLLGWLREQDGISLASAGSAAARWRAGQQPAG